MKTRYQITESSGFYFVTSTTVEWLPVFTKKQYFDIIIRSLDFCRRNKGLRLFAYVVMDNHIHLIVSGADLSGIMKDFKRHTAREIINAAGQEATSWLLNQFEFYKKRYKKESDYQVWQEGFHPQLITSDDVMRQKIEYIHNNPVKRGFVGRPEFWIYSSASNYLCGDGCLEIDLIEF